MSDLKSFLETDVFEGVCKHIKSEADPDTLKHAVNFILRDWLTPKGLIPPQEVPPGETDPDA